MTDRRRLFGRHQADAPAHGRIVEVDGERVRQGILINVSYFDKTLATGLSRRKITEAANFGAVPQKRDESADQV
jgi:hypothetical protein